MEAAEKTLDLIKRSELPLSEPLLNTVMSAYANSGSVEEIELFIKRFISQKPTVKQIDFHIKSHIRSAARTGSQYGIPSALRVLHAYENKSLFPSVQSYTRLISALFSTTPPTPPSNRYYTHAWDLFAHMQYVSGHTPDVLLYALMIRACAGTSSAGMGKGSVYVETERALDLWTEMTIDRKLTPNKGAYNAIINVLARSSLSYSSPDSTTPASTSSSAAAANQPNPRKTDSYYTHAFLLARQMFSSSLNAYGEPNPEMGPDGDTFKALLIAAKRRGDLGRARWILAEILRLDSEVNNKGDGEKKKLLDEEVMMHVLHAYASYRPPFKRSAAPLVSESSSSGSSKHTHTQSSSVDASTPVAMNEIDPDVEVSEVSERSHSDANQHSGESNEVENKLEQNINTADVAVDNEETPLSDSSSDTNLTTAPENRKYFTATPPQSRAEVIGEVTALFERVLYDNGLFLSSDTKSDTNDKTDSGLLSSGAFSGVAITTRLVNSYLSVYYVHSALSHCQDLYNTIFQRLQNEGLEIKKTLRTYVEALERCAKESSRGRKRRLGPFELASEREAKVESTYDYDKEMQWKWGSDIWDEWCDALEEIEKSKEGMIGGENARMTERAYAAVIRVCIL